MKNTKESSKIKTATNRLETTALDILRSKRKTENLKQLAPKLAEKLQAFAKFKLKQKDIGRDF